jgi:hypothetical protein
MSVNKKNHADKKISTQHTNHDNIGDMREIKPDAEAAARMRQLLCDNDLSQSACARLLKCSPTTVNRWAQGLQPPDYVVWLYLELRAQAVAPAKRIAVETAN